MTTEQRATEHQSTPTARHIFLGTLRIGTKLAIGFGLMIVFTLLVVAVNYITSRKAITTIERTGDLRVPVALASSHARTDLLQMSGNVRSYLALGDPELREQYDQSEEAFQADLDSLAALSPGFDAENQQRLEQLNAAFQAWKTLPEELFLLRDDQMAREPAYEWLNTEGTKHVNAIRLSINQMIQNQVVRPSSPENSALLDEMTDFQNSFTSMFSGLRGYVTTRNPNFRHFEYEANATINNTAWQNLVRKRDQLTQEQQTMLDTISENRKAFFDKVPTEVFAVLDSEEWRRDLYLFRTEALPLAEEMDTLLQAMSASQQQALLQDLEQGRVGLLDGRRYTIIGGGIAAVLGLLLAYVFWQIISGPMHRLTTVADTIRGGNLNAAAPVESRDEIGVFAETFNDMTAQMRQSMATVQQEKQRAAELQAEVIQAQETLLNELSTPLFPLADHVVAMPLIGSIDSTRAEQMMHTLLQGIERYHARIAILDITGVPVVDTQVASALVRTANAVRLLGTQVILTGIRAEVAQSLVDIGIDLRTIVTQSTLQDGIAYAFAQSSRESA